MKNMFRLEDDIPC